jgi:hypothetical protein
MVGSSVGGVLWVQLVGIWKSWPRLLIAILFLINIVLVGTYFGRKEEDKGTHWVKDTGGTSSSSRIKVHWRTKEELAKYEHNLLVIIPVRDRDEHVKKLVPRLNEYLTELNISYRIVVSEQARDGKLFNKATMMNVAYSLFKNQSDYVVFHDVDAYPLSVDYSYRDGPVHLGVAYEKNKWKLPYSSYIGAAIQMPNRDFEKVNGWTNNIYGWGCEDDEMEIRMRHAGLYLRRPPSSQGRFAELQHSSDHKSNVHYFNFGRNRQWMLALFRGERSYKDDGLSNLKYKLYVLEDRKELGGFTWILSEPMTPLQAGQRDRVTEEEIQAAKDQENKKLKT